MTSGLRRLVVILAVAAAVSPATAQQPPRTPAREPATAVPAQARAGVGFVRGVVYDSLISDPLQGARVAIRGTRFSTTTDVGGRFRIDSVPVGTYTVTYRHPGLDSAGLSSLSQRVTVERGRLTSLELSVPSHRTLRRLACRQEVTFGRDSGLVLGSLSDAETGDRIPGAAVVVTWVTARRGADGGVEVQRPRVEMVTDSLGNFYGCGVSTDLVATVQTGTADGWRTGVVEMLLGSRGVARHDLTVSREDVPGARDSAGQRRGLATLVGVVRDEYGRPRPSAIVSVDEAVGMAYADTAGRFALTGLPSGSHMLLARAMGYSAARRRVDLRNRDTTRVDLVMRQVTVLDTLRVLASSRVSQNELGELDQRIRMGAGYFLAGEEVKARASMRSVFQGLPSLTIEGRSVYNFRMYTLVSGRMCPVTLWVDGMVTDEQAVQSYRPDQIVAVEWYPRGSQAPMRFQSGTNAACAVLLLWTRFMR